MTLHQHLYLLQEAHGESAFLLLDQHACQQSPPLVVLHVDVDARQSCKVVSNPFVAFHHGHPKGRESPLISGLETSTCLKQGLHAEPPAVRAGIVETGVAAGVSTIWVGTDSQEVG